MKQYGLLGYPLGHTMSPPIHKRLFMLGGIAESEYEYSLKEIPTEELGKRIGEVKALDGANVTIPYKGEIIPYIDELAPSAERYTSVNCIVNENGRYIGYNTDCDGFLRSLAAAGGSLSGKVLQCGCGGVGRMMAIEAVRAGADLTLSLLPGFEDTAQPVRDYAEKNGIDAKITVVHPDEIKGSFDTLVNASPVGMFPKVDACPVTDEVIKQCGFVFDVVYNPKKTRLLTSAEKAGIPNVGGMAMLVWQAVVAQELWYGAEFKENDIDQLISDMSAML
ncbi:MAG: shikimate dehydrogenase [Oscillospiraceae bacterium]|nr:shikimate dehydrogenase [Oscillospiraceae bacterium]